VSTSIWVESGPESVVEDGDEDEPQAANEPRTAMGASAITGRSMRVERRAMGAMVRHYDAHARRAAGDSDDESFHNASRGMQDLTYLGSTLGFRCVR
jgi:hypothetical protein